MDDIIDDNTFLLLDVSDDSYTNSELSCNILDYSSVDSCSEFSSDEDLISARNFIKTDVENPPPPCPRFNFTGIPAVNVQFDDTFGELQFYVIFIDSSLMTKIVEETNRYVKQCVQSSIAGKFSKSKFWKETTVEEMHIFFALTILQGIIKKPGIDQYWSKRHSTYTSFFSQVMSHF
ncbi:PiggyBac transposable element-derived protein 4, partial [Stegodyphus mimosarum]